MLSDLKIKIKQTKIFHQISCRESRLHPGGEFGEDNK